MLPTSQRLAEYSLLKRASVNTMFSLDEVQSTRVRQYCLKIASF